MIKIQNNVAKKVQASFGAKELWRKNEGIESKGKNTICALWIEGLHHRNFVE
jgi:hypothetical protein